MKQAFTVLDLGFGDAGKGTIVDALARRYAADLVVRFNGGAQAGHNVVDAVTGNHHCFAQFGSGTFVPGCKTLLAAPVLVNPLAMLHEQDHLAGRAGVANGFNRMHVDGRCLLTTPYHRALNRLREMSKGEARHGSCGMGIGETVAYAMAATVTAPVVRDILDDKLFVTKLLTLKSILEAMAHELDLDFGNKLVQKEMGTFHVEPVELLPRYKQWFRQIAVLSAEGVAELLDASDTVIFEGAQGVLLDEDYGFHPYTTWAKTTTRNVHTILDEAECRVRPMTVGVTRVYATRHGAGPFPTEDQGLTRTLPDLYNPTNPWQSLLRCGWLDFELLRYALRVQNMITPVDALAVTCADQLPIMGQFRYAGEWDRPDLLVFIPPSELRQRSLRSAQVREAKLVLTTAKNHRFSTVKEVVEKQLDIPVGIVSSGRTSTEKDFLISVFA